MPQSSALRKEELLPAPTPITIDGHGVPRPPDAQIANDGSVTFNTGQQWWLYFNPTGVFGDANGLLKLENVGQPNGPYDPQQPNVTVSYTVNQPGNIAKPALVTDASASSKRAFSPGNTIKVG